MNDNNISLYKHYTSTSSFLYYDDEKVITNWSIDFFNHHILNFLPKKHDIRILEIGCGYGINLKALIDAGYLNVYGIDISEEQILYAKNKLKLTCVKIADALEFIKNEIEVKNIYYDVILMLDVIEHLDLIYSLELLASIYNILPKKGMLIIKVPNAISPLSPHVFWDITHLRGYTIRSIEQSLRLSSFTNIKHYSLPPFIHGFKSFLRYILWSYFINPIIHLLILIANGDSMGGIYTASFLTITTKD